MAMTKNGTPMPDLPAGADTEHYAYWLDRAAHNDYLWTECSACGFQIEALKAVETGWTSTEYVKVKYICCPICGRRMLVKSQPMPLKEAGTEGTYLDQLAGLQESLRSDACMPREDRRKAARLLKALQGLLFKYSG